MSLIETMDAFLCETVLYIASIGVFQLFVDSDVAMPAWMRIENLNQLVSKLIGIVVVLLAVSFLGHVSEWDGEQDILQPGIAIASIIIGLGFFRLQWA